MKQYEDFDDKVERRAAARDAPSRWLHATLELFKLFGGKAIVEIGSTRLPLEHPDSLSEGRSTLVWVAAGAMVHSVDCDAAAVSLTQDLVGENPNYVGVQADGREYLRRFNSPIDLLYLDAWDVGLPAYQERHCEAFSAALPNLRESSLVLIDDTDLDHGGKGRLVVEVAMAYGFQALFCGRQTLLSRSCPSDLLAKWRGESFIVPSLASFDEAVALHKSGCEWEAGLIYRELLDRDPRHAGALHLLGVVHHQMDALDSAIASIEAAIAIDGSKAAYHNNLGAAYLDAGQFEQAATCFEAAIERLPSYTDALSNLGLCRARCHREVEAEASYRAALSHDPNHLDSLRRLATIFRDRGDREQAVKFARRAVECAPDRPDLQNELGTILMSLDQGVAATVAFRRAIEIDPVFAPAYANLGGAYAAIERTEKAVRLFQRAVQLDPFKLLWRLRGATCCPVIFQSVQQLDEYRRNLEQTVDELAEDPPVFDWDELLVSGTEPPFALAFHGRNNRRLKTKFASIFRNTFPTEGPQAMRKGRRRVGFVLTSGHENIFLRCVAGIIERLNRNRIEPVIFCSIPSLSKLKSRMNLDGVGLVTFRDEIKDARKRIGDAECDVLYHWEVGTDPLNYFLPFLRLAPVQCTSWGTQVTSGVPNVDYYLSSELIEGPGADDHYSERLVRLPTLPTYQQRIQPPCDIADIGLGLPNDKRLYVCPQTLFKMHPDFDEILAGVLRSDPEGLIILKAGRFPYPAEQLRKRFESTMPDVVSRVRILPWLSLDDYYRLLSASTVVLDTLHFGAGSTTYDFFSLNLPVVSLPGEFNVGRYTQACYRKMGINHLLANSAEEYVRIASQVAQQGREANRIGSDQTGSIFQDLATVAAHEEFFAFVSVAQVQGS